MVSIVSCEAAIRLLAGVRLGPDGTIDVLVSSRDGSCAGGAICTQGDVQPDDGHVLEPVAVARTHMRELQPPQERNGGGGQGLARRLHRLQVL